MGSFISASLTPGSGFVASRLSFLSLPVHGETGGDGRTREALDSGASFENIALSSLVGVDGRTVGLAMGLKLSRGFDSGGDIRLDIVGIRDIVGMFVSDVEVMVQG